MTATVDSPQAWARLVLALTLSTIGGVGMWSVVVALPAVQADFGVARADASLPYTLTMIGFGAASLLLGRMADRHGIVRPVVLGAVALAVGYLLAAASPRIGLYALAHFMVGVGSAATFSPLLAHVSLWFVRRRGVAIGIFASGNYLAGTVFAITGQPVNQPPIATDDQMVDLFPLPTGALKIAHGRLLSNDRDPEHQPVDRLRPEASCRLAP